MIIRSERRVLKTRLKEQMRILKKSLDTNTHLSKVLEDAGWTYNDLIYERAYCGGHEGKAHTTLKGLGAHRRRNIPYISFFSGCGGLDLGLEAAGFSNVACFEINGIFCKTLRVNRPKWRVFGPPFHSGNISNTEETVEELSRTIKPPFPRIVRGRTSVPTFFRGIEPVRETLGVLARKERQSSFRLRGDNQDVQAPSVSGGERSRP